MVVEAERAERAEALEVARAAKPWLVARAANIFRCMSLGHYNHLTNQALVAPKSLQGVLVRGHAGLLINKLATDRRRRSGRWWWRQRAPSAPRRWRWPGQPRPSLTLRPSL